MNVAAIRVALTLGQQTAKHWKQIVLIVLSIFLVMVMGVMLMIFGSGNSNSNNLSESVKVWDPIVREYAREYGIPEYSDVILAIIMVETGGSGTDIMQSSESLGLPPNSITDPIASIDAGVHHLAAVVNDARSKGLDFWTPIQSYNFGYGFNDYVKKNGKQYSFELASNYSKELANGKKVAYSNPVANFNENFRYAYGNMYYVMLIQQYVTPGLGGTEGSIGNVDASPLGTEAYQALMSEVLKYQGWPYVWGGSRPSVGFDCSGLVQYSFGQIGYNLPRTAAEQYSNTIRIADPKPGDLVFFKGTNTSRPANSITHVGIYIDENRMYNASSSGIKFANWNQGYWKKHFAGFGRVVK